MAQLLGSTDKGISLQASTTGLGLLASKDLGVSLTADTGLSVSLLGEFGVGFTGYTASRFALEISGYLLLESTDNLILE